jgi:hypothetical protein
MLAEVKVRNYATDFSHQALDRISPHCAAGEGRRGSNSCVGDTWITDMTHYLDAEGRIVEMPRPAERLAAHLGAIVVAISPAAPADLDGRALPAAPRAPALPGIHPGLHRRR